MNRCIAYCCFLTSMIFGLVYADNQTATTTPILPGGQLPFTISVEQASFSLPKGLQSYVYAVHKDKLLLLTGLIEGLHSFDTGQNTNAFVVDLKHGTVFMRSLLDPASGLTPDQIDSLSATNAQNIQKGNTLYITGGYGAVNPTNPEQFTTKNTLTAVDVKETIDWVLHPTASKTLAPYVRQTFNEAFRVAGGTMGQGKDGLVLLMFGADLEGPVSGSTNPIYTEQVRRFFIYDDGRNLSVSFEDPSPIILDPNFRRRDGNMLPFIQKKGKELCPAYVALSGVFTLTDGVWTVPVIISDTGVPTMPNPNAPATFKQGMNNYESAAVELYSRKTGDNYLILFGGISYGYFVNGAFTTDPTLPFINQITTVKIDKSGKFSQYIMAEEFPVILSTSVDPGNQLLFGTDAKFFATSCALSFPNGVLAYDELSKKPVFLGYIIGGIQSVSGTEDTGASPYIFKVILNKK